MEDGTRLRDAYFRSDGRRASAFFLRFQHFNLFPNTVYRPEILARRL